MNKFALFLSTDAGFAAIFSAVATFIAAFLAQIIKGKVRLIWFSPSSTRFELQPAEKSLPVIHINSGQIIVQNLGRQAAQDVQITSVPGTPPAGYVLLPSLVHTTSVGPKGEWIVEIPFISSGEVVTLQILNGPLIESVRSAGGAGRLVPVIHQRLYPKWFQFLVGSLMLIGIIAIFFVIGWALAKA